MDVDLGRVAEIWNPHERRVGTGFRVAADLILTARHTVVGSAGAAEAGAGADEQADAEVEVRLFGTADWTRARIETVAGLDETTDLALLRTSPGALPPDDGPAPSWGRISGTSPVPVHAVGFPKATWSEEARDTTYVRGWLYPAQEALAFSKGSAVLHVTSIVPRQQTPTPGAPDPDSPWSGASGTAVFTQNTGLLIGVVTADYAMTDTANVLSLALVASTPALGVHAGAKVEDVFDGSRRTVEAVDRLQAALNSPASFRRDALKNLVADLELVHTDYLTMFEAILTVAPEPWEDELPTYTERIREAAALLRRLRIGYEAVRVRVHAAATEFNRAAPDTKEGALASAVLTYFPTGELHIDESSDKWRTSGTAVLEHFYSSLEGEFRQDLCALIVDTLTTHRQSWRRVCAAFAALQLDWGSTG